MVDCQVQLTRRPGVRGQAVDDDFALLRGGEDIGVGAAAAREGVGATTAGEHVVRGVSRQRVVGLAADEVLEVLQLVVDCVAAGSTRCRCLHAGRPG